MARARIVVADLDACASGGDLYHARRAGIVSKHQTHADLAGLAVDREYGPPGTDELVIFG